MPIIKYTTTISVEKTVGEIQKILSYHGANKLMIDYEDGEPNSISFAISISGVLVGYKLPNNWEGVLRVMNGDSNIPSRFKTNEQAKKVSWRIIKVWVDSQLALIESEQADLAQIFLPYALNSEGKTLYESFKENPILLIGN